MLGTYQGLWLNKKGEGEESRLGASCPLSLSFLDTDMMWLSASCSRHRTFPQRNMPFPKQWATANPSLGSFGQELRYSNEVECVCFTSGAWPCVNWCWTSSPGRRKTVSSPLHHGPNIKLRYKATRVHPGTPMSLLNFLTEHRCGVTYRNVGAPPKPHTGKSLRSRDDGFPVVI